MSVAKYARSKILYCIPADEDKAPQDIPEGCHFSQNTINSLIKLGAILRGIHSRLMKEGYSIIDGNLIAPDGTVVYESKRNTQHKYQRN